MSELNFKCRNLFIVLNKVFRTSIMLDDRLLIRTLYLTLFRMGGDKKAALPVFPL